MKPATPENITGWVLTGGQGSRMGGVDKGLQLFQGQALALTAAKRLAPQVHVVKLNANRHLTDYARWGYEVHADSLSGFAGPLAGMLTGFQQCDTEWLLTVPCDSPFFPLDLAHRLGMAVSAEASVMAMAWATETALNGETVCRPQPVFCLLHQSLQTSLNDFLHSGGRKIDAWTSLHAVARMDFTLPHDSRHAFANANTWQDLQDWQA
ncbi:MAG: molybdenum cofactor guanylyltransferase [Betaproteobacteria bacterium]|nr:molybdenum cofactor guanylyltransferase [Betaproteobacteria bacterium]